AVLGAAGFVAGRYARVDHAVGADVMVDAQQPGGLALAVGGVVVLADGEADIAGLLAGRYGLLRVGRVVGPAPVDAAAVLALVVRPARAAGEVPAVAHVPGGLGEGGGGGDPFLRLDEGTLPADGALLGAVHDRDVEADVVVLVLVVRAENPVQRVVAAGLEVELVAGAEIVGMVGAVFLVHAVGGETGRHVDAAVLVEVALARVAVEARHVGQFEVVVDDPVHPAAYRVGAAVQVRRHVDQRGPEILPRTRMLHQVHARRAAILEVLVREIPEEAVAGPPAGAHARGGLVLGVVLRALLHEQVGVDRPEVGRIAAGGEIVGLLLRQRRDLPHRVLVVDVAIVLFVHGGHAHREGVADRQVHRRAHAALVVVAQPDAAVAVETAIDVGLDGVEADRAGGG